MNEFEIIRSFFAKQITPSSGVTLGIGDDCALVDVPANHHLAITTDTLIEDVHFLKNTSAYDIGYKSLAVNLSDLAAMGATPAWFTLALSLPAANEQWLKEFSEGLFDLAKRYHVTLIGGDLTRGAQLTLTIAAYGLLEKKHALTRNAAKVGDLIYVTHTLGDAALALMVLQNKIAIADDTHKDFLINKLNRPEPRIELGKKLLPIAHAAIDISDGLAADLSHILTQSNVGAKIDVDALPLSLAMQQSIPHEKAIALALQGGDDYELCFTISPTQIALLPPECTLIGRITEHPGLTLEKKDGTPYSLANHGYQHF